MDRDKPGDSPKGFSVHGLEETMKMKKKDAGVGAKASIATVVFCLMPGMAGAADAPANTPANTPPCLIAGWENPQSVCVTHTKTIASTCYVCHGPSGKSLGAIPSLAGQDKAYFIAAMREFRTGKRDSTVMRKYAVGYTDTEYEALAEHFAAIK